MFRPFIVYVRAGHDVPVELRGVCTGHRFLWTQVGLASAQEFVNFSALVCILTP